MAREVETYYLKRVYAVSSDFSRSEWESHILLLFCVKNTRTVLRVDTGVRMVGRLGIHEGGQGASGKKDAEMDFSGGVKQWDKCKLRTALEWVVFTSSRTAK